MNKSLKFLRNGIVGLSLTLLANLAGQEITAPTPTTSTPAVAQNNDQNKVDDASSRAAAKVKHIQEEVFRKILSEDNLFSFENYKTLLGKGYRLGASGAGGEFDCSALVGAALSSTASRTQKQIDSFFGVKRDWKIPMNLPRTSEGLVLAAAQKSDYTTHNGVRYYNHKIAYNSDFNFLNAPEMAGTVIALRMPEVPWFAVDRKHKISHAALIVRQGTRNMVLQASEKRGSNLMPVAEFMKQFVGARVFMADAKSLINLMVPEKFGQSPNQTQTVAHNNMPYAPRAYNYTYIPARVQAPAYNFG